MENCDCDCDSLTSATPKELILSWFTAAFSIFRVLFGMEISLSAVILIVTAAKVERAVDDLRPDDRKNGIQVSFLQCYSWLQFKSYKCID